jgi:hypothetical protein
MIIESTAQCRDQCNDRAEVDFRPEETQRRGCRASAASVLRAEEAVALVIACQLAAQVCKKEAAEQGLLCDAALPDIPHARRYASERHAIATPVSRIRGEEAEQRERQQPDHSSPLQLRRRRTSERCAKKLRWIR